MKITFIGTGHGVPSADRSTSSTMITTGGVNYYVDAGAPISERTMKLGYKVEDAKAIFATHSHGDHIAGLYQFLDLYNWRYRDSEIEVYLPEERVRLALIELLSATTRDVDTTRIRISTYEKDTVYDDGNLRASFNPTAHMAVINRPSYGVLIEAEGKRIYFSGDLSQKLEANDFPFEMLNGIDLFVCELAHFTIADIGDRLSSIGAKRVAFNHVYPLEKYDELEALKGKFPFEILTPSDMEEIEI
jgi:ribonuclease BN (tRNA processing enzyme)